MTTTIKGADELKSRVGDHLGYSDWHEVTQEQVNQFAEATGDHQWIHVDPERAKSGPFGGPIAHGYLTLSMAPGLLHEVLIIEGFSMGVNYGINKLRFPAPVPVGKRLRVGATLKAADDVAGGVQPTLELNFEVEGQEKPACIAEVVYRYYA
jgi:acyl dehydratase